MIQIQKAVNADSRSADSNLNIKSLKDDTKKHIDDVSKGLDFISNELAERGSTHDHTKLENINEFYEALRSGNIKNSSWYNMHITTERHHLKSNPPKDVNLIDVLEHLVDCTMAGLTRSGNIYDIDLSPELLEKAVINTVELLKNNIYVVESNNGGNLNMNVQDGKIPLGLCKQAVMKLDAFITDVNEIVEDPDLEPEDKQDFETMTEMAGTMLATIINIVNKECEEHVFLGEKVPMDIIDEYPEEIDNVDIMDEEIE